MCGLVSTLMSVAGTVPVCSANVPRSTDTQPPLSHHSRPPMLDLTSSTSISLGRYHLLVDLLTSSPALIDSPAGLKPFPSPPSLQKLWHKPSSVDGFHDLVYPPLSSQTADANSNLTFGVTLCPSLAPNVVEPQLITLRQMAWSNDFTASLKPPLKLNQTLMPGWKPYPSSS